MMPKRDEMLDPHGQGGWSRNDVVDTNLTGADQVHEGNSNYRNLAKTQPRRWQRTPGKGTEED